MDEKKREEVEQEIDDAGCNGYVVPSGWTTVESYKEAIEEGLTHEEAVERVADELEEELESAARRFANTVKEQLEKLKE